MRAWRHSGFHVDRSVRLAAHDRAGVRRLVEYTARGPFSLARIIRITPAGQVLYRAEKPRPREFPLPGTGDLFGGPGRNFQLFDPLDFLAELTQHIPDKGEHPQRYFGWYSSKSRGLRAQATTTTTSRGRKAAVFSPVGRPSRPSMRLGVCPHFASSSRGAKPGTDPFSSRGHGNFRGRGRFRGWAALIKLIYHVDPLRCPKCGGAMKVIAFVERHQADVIDEKILRHCGLWQEPDTCGPPPPAGPPGPAARSSRGASLQPVGWALPTGSFAVSTLFDPDSSVTLEPDGDYLDDHARED